MTPPPSSGSKTLLSPVLSLLLLITFFAAVCCLKLPQEQALWVFSGIFTFITLLHPGNGIYLLTLVVPFFLGDEKRPYFFMLDAMTLVILTSTAIHIVMQKQKNTPFPHQGKILLFLAASLLSIPINAKGLYYHLNGTPVLESWNAFWSGQENSPLYYLRCLLHTVTNVLLYFTVLWSFRNESDFKKWLKPFMILNLLMWSFALCLYFRILPKHPKFYLSASLIGQYPIGEGQISITGFAYNAGYLGEYWILAFPLVATLLYAWRTHLFSSFAAALTLVLGLGSIPFLYQRGPVLALAGQLFFFCAFWIWHSKRRLQTLKWASLFCLLCTLVFFALDHFFLQGVGLMRLKNMFSNPSLRDQIWQVALTMFAHHPLLGIGLGKFHYFFPEYCKLAGIPWDGHIRYVRSTAHNVYFHMLAEQGIVGLGVFLLTLASIFNTALLKFKKLSPENKPLALALLTALFGWACYGFTQHVFYLRSLQIFFWIVLAFLGILYRPVLTLKPTSKETVLWFGVLWMVFWVYRLMTITA